MIVCNSPFSTSTSLRFPSESSLITFLGLFEAVTSCSVYWTLEVSGFGMFGGGPMSNFFLLGGGPMGCFCF
ncbi:hypothetical protein Hanom_Chr06g00552951 [Helianthus anomalus]